MNTWEGVLTEKQQRCIPDVSFELIPIKNLVSNQDYQRPLSEGHIRKALEEFDVYQINPVKVSRREGINFVFDGQHTIEIVATESGSRETPVWCMVYDELKYTEEAHIFADQQKHVKKLSPYETFLAHIEAGDEKQTMINTIVRSYGLSVTRSKQPSGICAITTLERIYDKFGQQVLNLSLRLAVTTWEGEMNSLSGGILMGLAKIIVSYGDSLKEEIFRDHVGKEPVSKLIRMGKERRAGHMGIAEAMIILYNTKNTKYKLSMRVLYGGKNITYEYEEEDEAEKVQE